MQHMQGMTQCLHHVLYTKLNKTIFCISVLCPFLLPLLSPLSPFLFLSSRISFSHLVIHANIIINCIFIMLPKTYKGAYAPSFHQNIKRILWIQLTGVELHFLNQVENSVANSSSQMRGIMMNVCLGVHLDPYLIYPWFEDVSCM